MVEGVGVPRNERDLREMVYHTDARVSSLESQVASVVDSLGRIETLLMNRHPTNWAAWVGVAVTVLGIFIGALYAVTQYVELTQAPIRDVLKEHTLTHEDLRQFQRETHYEFGRMHERWRKLE